MKAEAKEVSPCKVEEHDLRLKVEDHTDQTVRDGARLDLMGEIPGDDFHREWIDWG